MHLISATHLLEQVIPPVFNYCTSVISYKDEINARNKYWKVVTQARF
jgi:hypothetical protein